MKGHFTHLRAVAAGGPPGLQRPASCLAQALPGSWAFAPPIPPCSARVCSSGAFSPRLLSYLPPALGCVSVVSSWRGWGLGLVALALMKTRLEGGGGVG